MDLQKTSRLWMTPILALTVSSCVSVAAEQAGQLRIAPVIVQQLPSKSRILVARPRIIEGKQFTFVKYEDEKGILRAEIFNERNQRIPESALPKPQLSLITKPLQNILAQSRNPNDVFRVNIALRVETLNDSGPPTTGSAEVMENQQPKLRLNGREITEPALRSVIQQPLQRNAQLNLKHRQLIQTRLNTLAQRHGLMNRPAMRAAIENANATLTIELKQSEILQIARQSQDLIAGIELYIEPKDEISDAMKSSRVDPHAINHAGRKGNGIGIYMTESGCPNAGHITSYRKLAGSRTDHSENVSAILRAVAPESYVYCRGGAVLPTATDLNGYDNHPRIHIVNRSNGSGDDANYAIADRDWDNFVYDNRVAVFKSAGNNGNANGYLSSPGKGLNIIAVGNYNDSNSTIASNSSYKDPETDNDKPEISFPGTSVTAGGHTMSGTSMASPHGAAFAADMMSSYSWLQLKPYLVKAKIMAGATKAVTGGLDKVGVGGGDFYDTIFNGQNAWWEGNNNTFSHFDSIDPFPNNGSVDFTRNLPASLSRVRVALAWLNRGNYSYDHRSDAHSIGMDLDLRVYDPNGRLVASSMSWDNPYEVVNFDPKISGNYRFRISRFANRDTNSKLHMGLVISW